MKYIRTTDNKLYEVRTTDYGEKYLIRPGELIPMWNTGAYEIAKQADLIEMLCDEFVLVNPLRFRKPKTATELDKDFIDMFILTQIKKMRFMQVSGHHPD